MLYRSITERIEQFFEKEKKAALMVTGARQVGKDVYKRQLHNRFDKIELPQVLSFCGGTRFVPIISGIVFVGVGILMLSLIHI